jgi:hypothetical protein
MLIDPAHGHAQLLGLVEGQHLGRQFAGDHMQKGNDDEGEDIGHGMRCLDQVSLSPNSAKIETKVESVSVLIVSMPTAPRPSETSVMPTWVTE